VPEQLGLLAGPRAPAPFGERLGREQPVAREAIAAEERVARGAERAAQPGLDRHLEAALRAARDGGAEAPLGERAQHQLALRSRPERQRLRQPEARLDEAVVEEGDAGLEAAGHGRAVDLGEHVVGQRVREIAREGLLQRRAGGAPKAVERRREPGLGRGGRGGEGRGGRERGDLGERGVALGVGAGEPAAGPAERAQRARVAAGAVGAGGQAREHPAEGLAREGYRVERAAQRDDAVLAVAGEDLVAAVAAEDDLVAARGELGDEVGRHERAVAEGLVEGEQGGGEVRARRRLVDEPHRVRDAERARRLARGRRLVERGVAEAHRVGLEPLARGVAGVGRDERRVDAAAQERGDGHVALEVLAHRAAQERLDDLARLVERARPRRLGRGPGRPVARALRFARAELELEARARLEARDPLVDRALVGHIAPGEHGVGGARVGPQGAPELGRRRREGAEAAQVGGEGEVARALGDEERLDAEPIAAEQKPPAAAVVDREGPHAGELIFDRAGIALVEAQDDLGVAAAAEGHALRAQRAAQRRGVVDLAVEDEHDRAVFVLHRLLPALHVDDGEPLHRQRRGRVRDDAPAVGAPPRHGLGHGRAEGERCGLGQVEAGEAGNAAHAGLG
jgi:hypothetical protein